MVKNQFRFKLDVLIFALHCKLPNVTVHFRLQHIRFEAKISNFRYGESPTMVSLIRASNLNNVILALLANISSDSKIFGWTLSIWQRDFDINFAIKRCNNINYWLDLLLTRQLSARDLEVVICFRQTRNRLTRAPSDWQKRADKLHAPLAPMWSVDTNQPSIRWSQFYLKKAKN